MLCRALLGIVEPVKPTEELHDEDRAVLDFERSWWISAAGRPKSRVIREELGYSPSQYYERLRRLSASAQAAAYDPLVVARLHRRARATRRAQFFGEPSRQLHPR